MGAADFALPRSCLGPAEEAEEAAQTETQDMESGSDVIDGCNAEAGHIIATTIRGSNGLTKQSVTYIAEHVVGTGSFGVVYQAKCRETGEIVAIKKVLQDKRYKNRELQIMHMLDHPNIVGLKHYFSTTERDELYLNLVLDLFQRQETGLQDSTTE